MGKTGRAAGTAAGMAAGMAAGTAAGMAAGTAAGEPKWFGCEGEVVHSDPECDLIKIRGGGFVFYSIVCPIEGNIDLYE